jgi:hypothetical protein
MDLPVVLYAKIVSFLSSLPNIHDSESQRALVCSAGLESEVQNQIHFDKPTAQFVPLLVSTLLAYGKLRDGRYALEAILIAGQHYVGQEKKELCNALVNEVRGILHTKEEEYPLLKGQTSQMILESVVEQHNQEIALLNSVHP